MRTIAVSDEEFVERINAETQWGDDGGNVIAEIEYVSAPKPEGPKNPVISRNPEREAPLWIRV